MPSVLEPAFCETLPVAALLSPTTVATTENALFFLTVFGAVPEAVAFCLTTV